MFCLANQLSEQQKSCAAGDDSSADVSAALNLVTSLLKVADIEEVRLLLLESNKSPFIGAFRC